MFNGKKRKRRLSLRRNTVGIGNLLPASFLCIPTKLLSMRDMSNAKRFELFHNVDRTHTYIGN